MNSLTPQRVFLGLDQPPLLSAVNWIVSWLQSEQQGTTLLDLSEFVIVLPSARAEHRLLQLLVAATEEQNIRFSPPVITTLGQFPEYLYTNSKPLASELDQQIAWSRVLEETPASEIELLTGRSEKMDASTAQSLALVLSKLHARLANDIWSFSSVARELANIKGFLKQELARWTVLASVQKRYYQILENAGLWDKQAARNYAAAGLLRNDEIRCRTDKRIIMLATADLNRSMSEMLRQIVTQNADQVQILVASDVEMQDCFDAYGSLITERWLGQTIAVPDSKIVFADRPSDQAQTCIHLLTNLDEDVATDEITIGVADETLTPQLERGLNAIDLPARNLAGKRLSETSPVLLLDTCREYLSTYSYDAFANLVRHPDLYHWMMSGLELSAEQDFLGDLAKYQNTNLPSTIRLDASLPFGDPAEIANQYDRDDPSSIKRAKSNAEKTERLNAIHRQLAKLLSPLDGGSRQIAEWAPSWIQLLLEVYGAREFNPLDSADRQIVIACQAIHAALLEQQNIPESLGIETSASVALDWALHSTSEHRVVPPPVPEAIELAGWLDLILDDAPVMVVTGMNDENVPSSESAHQFIPNELCKQLGILDNDRRFARDCYALHVIASVRNNYYLIAGRRNSQGEPLKPSRLLFADTAEVAARRAKAFFSFSGNPNPDFWLYPVDQCHPDQQFPVPEPVVGRPVTQLTVTRFREYMKCPYRFYLKHILRLETVVDDQRELDAGLFGDLAHNCLEAFGKSELRDSTDEKQILEFLNDELDTVVNREWSGSRLPAVNIQIANLRLRFERISEQQAQRRRDGWQIVSTEEMLEHDLIVDGEPFCIRGKIDRVDQHEITRQIAVWDYKTSAAGKSPNEVHYAPRKKEWKDLQLPLYRHLVREVAAVAGGDFDSILMGFILLPNDLKKVGFYEAEWSAKQLEAADESARDIIRRIRNGEFWPHAIKPPLYSEDFAAICQDRVFESAP